MLAEGASRSPVTRVQFHKGTDGVKQMMWNETKGTTENLSILYEKIANHQRQLFEMLWEKARPVDDLKGI
ncbi:MAG TPA: hypothetical protein VMR45_04940 [Patescibacteria group bacterium]|nr:hypothetical protein [Patescibacteria group bacterium]